MKQENSLENQTLKYLFWVITACLLILIIVIALKFPVLEHDVWWYHLPFAGLLHNIDDFREKFGMIGLNAERYAGFPKLMNWIQGLCWRLTGQLGGLALPNALSLVFYISFCWFWMKLRPDFLVPLLLSIPLLAIHVTSAYIDLAVNISIAIQFLAGFLLVKSATKKPKNLIIFYLLAALIAGNSKFPSTLSALIVGTILIGGIFYFKSSYFRRLLGVFLVGLVLSSMTLLHNLFLFGNPFYPIKTLGLPGTEYSTDDNSSLTYTNFMGPLKNPVNWMLSITELDWKIRGVTTSYNILSYAGDNALRGGKGRTGGCWGSFMVVNFGLLAYFFIHSHSRKSQKLLHDLIMTFLILTVMTAFLPHSQKMRFYLYVPILLITINSYALGNLQFPKTGNRLALIAWLILCLSWLTNPGIILDQWTMKPTLPGLSSYSIPFNSTITDTEIVNKIQESIKQGHSEICLPSEGEGGVGAKASAYALLYGEKDFKIIQGYPNCLSSHP